MSAWIAMPFFGVMALLGILGMWTPYALDAFSGILATSIAILMLYDNAGLSGILAVPLGILIGAAFSAVWVGAGRKGWLTYDGDGTSGP